MWEKLWDEKKKQNWLLSHVINHQLQLLGFSIIKFSRKFSGFSGVTASDLFNEKASL